MAEHFNRLTEAEQERLAILIEECAEVSHVACKILRHGYESTNPSVGNLATNREALQRELGDLLHAVDFMEHKRDVNPEAVDDYRMLKSKLIARYLHHQAEAD
jgi:NTP pyrophosphatase (non-canonical NTP hydrolase)